MTVYLYAAFLLLGIVFLAAGIWLLRKSRAAIWLLAAGVALIGLPTAIKARDLVREFRAEFDYLHEIAQHSQNLHEMHAEGFTRALLAQQKYQDTRNLNRYEAKIYAQSGEDGIIAEIFRRIGTSDKYFVEFGSSDGRENNTVYLLNEGWGGLWIDGDTEKVQHANQSFSEYVNNGKLKVRSAFITAENIQDLFAEANVPSEFDLLSIDIDRNDYYVWRSIERYRPRVAIVEYNGIFPAGVQWVVPYDANAWWDRTSRAGASLTALELLGREKGYALVGCTLSGVNAFFVRSELAGDKFQDPFTAAVHYEPPRYFLNDRRIGHPRRP